MTKVWFNRWFSTAYHYIHHIRNNEDDLPFTIYGTHPDPLHMSLQACDHAETEPALPGDEYVEYCLDYCRRHGIDIFIPRLHMYPISKNVKRFEENGTRVMVCQDHQLLKQLLEKDKFYQSVQETGVMELPDYFVVNTAEEFRAAYDKLVARGHRVCIKPTASEGGFGFRIVDNERDRLKDLLGPIKPYVSFDEVYSLLSKAGRVEDLMVMELLEGDEYSIDCLSDAEGRLYAAIPRRKAGGRVRVLEPVPELVNLAERLAKTYKIPYNFNIQVKYNRGIPKLLEINPRMSGGLHISCMSGVNFPYLAVRFLLGLEVPEQAPDYDIVASHVEQPILMRLIERS